MSADSVQVVELPSQFAQVQLSGLKDIVDHHRADGNSVQFNAAEVERMDGAAVQFLLAVSQLQSASSISPLVLNSNEIVQVAFADMGVIDMITTDNVPATSEASE